MTRYHFDVHNGVEVLDAVGTKLPGLDAARAHALQVAAAYTSSPAAAVDGTTVVVEVREGDGKPAFTVRLVAMIDAA